MRMKPTTENIKGNESLGLLTKEQADLVANITTFRDQLQGLGSTVPAPGSIVGMLLSVSELTHSLIQRLEEARSEVNDLMDSMDDSVISDETERLAVYEALLDLWRSIGVTE